MMLLAQIPSPDEVISNASKYSWEAGVLAFVIITFICGVGFAFWKFGWYMVYKVFGNDEKGTRGTLGEWVDVEKKHREVQTETLQRVSERLDAQTKVCIVHGDTVKAVVDSLGHIDEVLDGRTEIVEETHTTTMQLKACLFHLCDLCASFVQKEFPNSASDVNGYLLAIKRTVNNEKVA
jgi:hypothetical protein